MLVYRNGRVCVILAEQRHRICGILISRTVPCVACFEPIVSALKNSGGRFQEMRERDLATP